MPGFFYLFQFKEYEPFTSLPGSFLYKNAIIEYSYRFLDNFPFSGKPYLIKFMLMKSHVCYYERKFSAPDIVTMQAAITRLASTSTFFHTHKLYPAQ